MKKLILSLTLSLISAIAFCQVNKPVVKIENKDYYLVDVSGSKMMVRLTGGEGNAHYDLTCRVQSMYYPAIMDVSPSYGSYGSASRFFCTCDKSYMKTVGVGNVIEKRNFNTYFGPLDGGDGFTVTWLNQ